MSAGASPLVSVVVLTFNRRLMLAETVAAVLAQSVDDLEVLIVDNESDDGTELWATSRADPRVRYLRHANGGNLSVNRNFALEHALGRWIAFCDDDDVWMPTKLQAQLAVAAERPTVGIIGTNAVAFGPSGEMGPLIEGRSTGPVAREELFRPWHPIVLSSALVDRTVFEKVGPFDTDPAIFTIEDFDMWLRASRACDIWFIDEPLVRYRVHDAMTSHRDLREVLAKERVMFDRLAASGAISEAEHGRAVDALQAESRVAAGKEALKRMPGAVGVARALRAAAWRLRSGGR